METAFAEVERLALNLDVTHRGQLASVLLRSLPVPWNDELEDDGIEDAIRRSAEIEQDPSMAISHEEFLKFFEDRKRK